MTELSQCLACGETTFSPYLTCTDYTVSHETFNIVQCTHCKFTFTNPSPEVSKLGSYYESRAYVSHSSRPTTFMDHVYVMARTQTIKWKTRIIKKYVTANPISLLDYGCGTGDFLTHCKLIGWNVSGIEPSTSARQIAATKSKQTIYPGIDQMPPTHFDVITLWHVLEHVPNLHTLIESLAKSLKETGTIFIAVPNRNSWDAKYYKNTWAAFDVPRHLWHFTRQDMQKIMHAHSLNVVSTIPMKLDAYYVSLLSEKYRNKKSGPLTLIKSLLNGLRSNMSGNTTSEYSSHIYVIKK
ncbi:MAG TPA: class I SAM-dependent methyltransferase [Chryseolinea sp.]|nr:class I SAM-dependent methyltransferase [Chryseolinea sp.]